MPTKKRRITFAIDDELLSKINQYSLENNCKNQSQAVTSLLDRGVHAVSSQVQISQSASVSSPDIESDFLLNTFHQMRIDSGMTLDEISQKSGIPRGTLAKISCGITKSPSLETMRSLVHAMGYTLDVLEKSSAISPEESTEYAQLSALMAQLNKEGQDRVIEYAKDLVAGKRFEKFSPTNLKKNKE